MEYCTELRAKDLRSNSSFATNQLYDLGEISKFVWASKNGGDELGFESGIYLL